MLVYVGLSKGKDLNLPPPPCLLKPNTTHNPISLGGAPNFYYKLQSLFKLNTFNFDLVATVVIPHVPCMAQCDQTEIIICRLDNHWFCICNCNQGKG